jgi:glycosyltransferase involved in cell wall biosynthesis
MKILFDHQIFSIQIFGGASKYFFELFKRLPRDDWNTTTRISNNVYIQNTKLFKYWNPMPEHYFKGKAQIMDQMNRLYTINQLRQGEYDIFHQTHFGNWCHKAIGNKKMVVTFHDMNHSRFVDLYRQNGMNNPDAVIRLQKQSVERADKIIAVSNNTKNDLVNIWNIDSDKITVIHHGIDEIPLTGLSLERVITAPYILFVGERYKYKNFDGLSKAFRSICNDYPDLKLVCTGKKLNDDELKMLKLNNIENRTIQISADEQTMARLYRDAMLFVYPSFYEGFGMPILEAMLYGCPVVLSDTSCFPEVAGSAGLFFDPFQVDDIADKIKLLMNNSALRKDKVRLGKERLAHFSWEKTASEHIKVYQELIG